MSHHTDQMSHAFAEGDLSDGYEPPLMSEMKVVLIGALLIGIGPVSMVLYTPAMPELVGYFATTEAMVKMTVTLYFGGFSIAQLVCGPLSDGLGRRPVILGFMAVYLLACMMILLSPNVEIMLAARFLQGIGAAMGVAIARAIVRDVFADGRALKVMNLMGLFIAIAPAIAPAVGGLTLAVAPWQALFVIMLLMGVATMLVALFSLKETVERDVSRIRPRALIASYRTLLMTPYFMLASLVVAGSLGAIYALVTILPFVLMDQVGQSPVVFGFSQILQAGAYMVGALVVLYMLRRVGQDALVPAGLLLVVLSSAALIILLAVYGPTFTTVMGPIAVYSFGVAFIMPAMLTNSLMPFPKIAGAASALTAFLQMAAGLLGSALASLFTNPSYALATIVPVMGGFAVLCWFYWRRLPTPETHTL